ncbi:adhesion G protein-coupled receptor E2-like [Patiria miniata]|uniref:Uncharacterized protein n=1 Tax=Patiria miniata TaxID=46514 RepID=A0A914A1D3_PATMI|nr:adhesion G protein-coupled receptor E2-like [Patiria miniata]
MEEGMNGAKAPGHPSAVSGGLIAVYQQMERRKWSILFSLCLLLACFGDKAVAQNTCPGQDGLLTSWTSYVRSANFGSASYTNNQRCFWHISVAQGNRVQIRRDDFQLEGRTTKCWDFLKVYDGSDANAPLIGEYCGTEFPEEITSTGSSVYLHFETDSVEGFRGFQLHYTGVCSGITIDVPTDGTGALETPLHPGTYPASIACDWTLQTQSGYRIDMDFEVFDLSSVSDCTASNVLVYDGTSAQSDRLAAQFCGTEVQRVSPLHDVSSSTNEAFLTFQGAAEPGQGFRLVYSTDIDECMNHLCQNGATCVDGINEYSCNCDSGFKGTLCAEVHYCFSAPCRNGGNCEDGTGTFMCTCMAGYEGLQCEIDTDECSSSPCQNGGACSDAVDGYTCHCPGYEGAQCQTEIDECASNPCSQYGNCDNLVDAYACHCLPGYVGVHCETDFDECASGPCQYGSTCVDMVNGYQCVCIAGYDGIQCETDIDECSSHPCLNGGTCQNDINEFSCACVAGFEGTNCETDIDECFSGPCQNDAICVDAVNGYSCNCSLGYRGVHCEENIDECAGSPCQHGATCIDEVNQYQCVCLTGYDGVRCQNDINECSSDPCKNGGKCVDKVNAYNCDCKAGYVGVNCQTDVDECSSDPCLNGGTCDNLVNRFQCRCVEGFIGDRCEAEDRKAICAGGPDGIEGSGLVWDDTEPGHTSLKSCPEGANGNASRLCDLTATWSNPDLSQCVSPAFAEINGKAELLKSGNASAGDVLDLANTLQNITKIPGAGAGAEGGGGKAKQIYPGDMEVATNSLSVISEVVGSVKNLDVGTAKDLTKACAGTINNVVDESQIHAWKNTNNPEKVASSVTTMITSAEAMANVVSRQQAQQLGTNPDDTSLMIKDKNIELQISVFRSNDTDQQDSFLGGAAGEMGADGLPLSSIVLPEDLLDAADGNGTGYVGVMKGRFSSVGELFSLGNDKGENQDRKDYVNTDVLSLRVLGLPESDFQNLETPIRLVFRHKQVVDADNTSCVFLNTSAENLDDRWNDAGCEVESSNDTHTVCVCSHLTNFAILMDVHGSQSKLPEAHNTALSVLSYIGGTLSILGCFFSIAIYQFFRLKSDRIRVHMHLAAAIAIAQLIFLVGIERNEIAWVCKVIAVVLHYSLTAMFCWMLVEGIQLYLALVHVFGSSSHIKKYLLIGWGAPVIIVGISFGVFFKDYGSGTVCWLTQQMLLIIFVPTVGILIILNTAVLIIVLKVMMTSMTAREKSKDNDTSQIKTGLKAALVLLPLLGLTWVFGFLSVNEYTLVFTYLFAICNSLQGLFFFIAHCVMNIEVKRAYERRYGRKKGLHSMTTSSTAPMSSRTQSSMHKSSDVSTTELIKRNSTVNTVSGGYDNPSMKDTTLSKDPAKPKDNSMNNTAELTTDTKKAASDPVKVNDIQCLVKNSEKVNDEEKGLVEGAKVAMETIVSKDSNLKMDGTNIA